MPDALRACVAAYGPLPDSYLVFDLETTGLDREIDLITQAGWCEVRDRAVVDCGASVLNWTKPELGVDQVWLRQRLDGCRAHMEADGKRYPWTADVLSRGECPVDVLGAVANRLLEAAEQKLCFVGHNAWRLDVPFLEAAFRRFLSYHYRFPDQLFDTGAVEKALQLGAAPREGESLGAFCRRVLATRARGVYYSLDRHCIPKYSLDVKWGLDMSKAHTAQFDCLCTHHLLEEFRGLLGG